MNTFLVIVKAFRDIWSYKLEKKLEKSYKLFSKELEQDYRYKNI